MARPTGLIAYSNPKIADVLVKSGISILADSRTENIIRMCNAGIQSKFLLLRTPSLSQAEAVVKHADISLNSEISVIKKLSKFAIEFNTTHKIILMEDREISGLDYERIVRRVKEQAENFWKRF